LHNPDDKEETKLFLEERKWKNGMAKVNITANEETRFR
jgi:hypothetical protein